MPYTDFKQPEALADDKMNSPSSCPEACKALTLYPLMQVVNKSEN